ncbi:hypothetical protein B484DRAFT_396704 [Ochromonadaceae sp. CCMP2298]|nr:hypothetical protein B484DRAFT_396704 [Ochromonadaceae sp. CCMP2298]|mmetsp:Transcript_30830/g.69976  ORF Transcript_30830/g.69976 Transcript_30830/m.69976 type:complete len:1062 (+) Transcript_30830:153-3338(+)
MESRNDLKDDDPKDNVALKSRNDFQQDKDVVLECSHRIQNKSRFASFVTGVYQDRQMVFMFCLHSLATLLVWQHFFLIKYNQKLIAVPIIAHRYNWKVFVPSVEFGTMHAILLQFALLPLTMSRHLVTVLSGSPALRRVVPFHRMTDMHVYLGYLVVVVTFLSTCGFIMFFGLLCYEQNMGLEPTPPDNERTFCTNFQTEIMGTGYGIIAGLLLLGGSSYLRHSMPYELFYALHHLVFVIFAVTIAHTLDANFRRGQVRSQTFKWFSASLVLYFTDRIYMWANQSRCDVVRCESFSTAALHPSASMEAGASADKDKDPHATNAPPSPQRDRERARAVLLALRRPLGFDFQPGQYAYLKCDRIDPTWHPFSVASDSHSDLLEFYIETRGDPGSWTHRLWELGKTVGTSAPLQVQVMGPYGPQLDLQDHTHLLLIGTGTGVVPMLSALQKTVRELTLLAPQQFLESMQFRSAFRRQLVDARSQSLKAMSRKSLKKLWGKHHTAAPQEGEKVPLLGSPVSFAKGLLGSPGSFAVEAGALESAGVGLELGVLRDQGGQVDASPSGIVSASKKAMSRVVLSRSECGSESSDENDGGSESSDSDVDFDSLLVRRQTVSGWTRAWLDAPQGMPAVPARGGQYVDEETKSNGLAEFESCGAQDTQDTQGTQGTQSEGPRMSMSVDHVMQRTDRLVRREALRLLLLAVPLLELTMATLVLSWHYQPAANVTDSMKELLQVGTFTVIACFLVLCSCSFDARKFCFWTDVVVLGASLFAALKWSDFPGVQGCFGRGRHGYGEFDVMQVVAYVALAAYRGSRDYVIATTSLTDQIREEERTRDTHEGAAVQGCQFVWVTRDASRVQFLWPRLCEVYDKLEQQWGAEHAARVLDIRVYVTDQSIAAREALLQGVAGTALFRLGALRFGRPDFSALAEAQLLRRIEEADEGDKQDHAARVSSSSSSTLVAFCGGLHLGRVLGKAVVDTSVLAYATRYRLHTLDFLQLSQGSEGHAGKGAYRGAGATAGAPKGEAGAHGAASGDRQLDISAVISNFERELLSAHVKLGVDVPKEYP